MNIHESISESFLALQKVQDLTTKSPERLEKACKELCKKVHATFDSYRLGVFRHQIRVEKKRAGSIDGWMEYTNPRMQNTLKSLVELVRNFIQETNLKSKDQMSMELEIDSSSLDYLFTHIINPLDKKIARSIEKKAAAKLVEQWKQQMIDLSCSHPFNSITELKAHIKKYVELKTNILQAVKGYPFLDQHAKPLLEQIEKALEECSDRKNELKKQQKQTALEKKMENELETEISPPLTRWEKFKTTLSQLFECLFSFLRRSPTTAH